jgi:hypothetical protein
MQGCLRVPRTADKFVASNTGRSASSLFPQALGLLCKSFFERCGLRETTTGDGHRPLLSIRGRRERYRAFSSQMKATYRAVMAYKRIFIG